MAGLAAGAVYAQEGQQPQQPQTPPSDSSKVSVTGCLTKGVSNGEYVIADQKTGAKVPFAGPAQLDKYVNQTVRLTGTVSPEASGKTFKPDSINQVSPSCEGGK